MKILSFFVLAFLTKLIPPPQCILVIICGSRLVVQLLDTCLVSLCFMPLYHFCSDLSHSLLSYGSLIQFLLCFYMCFRTSFVITCPLFHLPTPAFLFNEATNNIRYKIAISNVKQMHSLKEDIKKSLAALGYSHSP